MAKKGPMRYRDFLAKLKPFGVIERPGKGSEMNLLRPNEPGSSKGPRTPIRHHSDNDEIPLGTLKACLRRLGIPDEAIWDD